MKDMILFPEDIERLNAVLSQLVTKSNLLLAVLINKDGRLLTSQGSLDNIDIVSMAALVAGNSASTLAIANLMGEREFSTMYHQGKDKHIYIAAVDDNTFLALVFDDRTNIDRVKVFARQFDRQLKHTLFQVYNKTEDMVDLDLDMGFGNQSYQQHAQQMQSQPSDYVQQTPQSYVPDINLNPGAGEQLPPANMQFDNSMFAQQSQDLSLKEDDGVIYMEPPKNVKAPDPNDTNYLFLKNKIRESVKRKADE
ncbi:MAG TPA: roadblock/LC7 domain-containing protein [Chitinispirillaceae bacterium]|nr:roadblock/LC7 domain-containing protein [Chitinispirillaceae bacterium]